MKTIFGAAVAVVIACIASFSVGDELGFSESIGNLEGGRRRALSYRNGLPNNIGVLPANYQPNAPVNRNAPRVKMPPPNRLTTTAPTYKRAAAQSPLMTQAASLPLGVPPFKPIPVDDQKKKAMEPRPFQPAAVPQNFTFVQPLPMKPISQNLIGGENYNMHKTPVFHPMPSSVSRISTGDIVEVDNHHPMQQQELPTIDLMGHTVEELAAAANVSVEAIRQAIFMRQQQLMTERRRNEVLRNQLREVLATSTTTTTTPATTTTTTVMPTKQVTMRPFITGQKVMNAPKEYYPVGYDKNFDDNFTSKVDLPPTSFHCGDQKHFPGLYADVDLGCMVFHVCAFTDDGLIMKSFLCPESTLFDQTILKCNWWFYVDCKTSKDLYDSNIPISKSYQLMKSLTYFSNYKKTNSKDTVDLEALQNTVTGSSNKLT
ncbi:uncharacterized protein LOC119660153 isoform X2 [Hermetia illucens]|uniref:uncharacterized protein LOC119660153 isoform X2 n=1 Tax=Hermetia illucens TaxID=343691 RepID=UPI0018CBFED0|nr:uncharacterized protein LOC119660153 isoform X2 [Hermetia illucens]